MKFLSPCIHTHSKTAEKHLKFEKYLIMSEVLSISQKYISLQFIQ